MKKIILLPICCFMLVLTCSAQYHSPMREIDIAKEYRRTHTTKDALVYVTNYYEKTPPNDKSFKDVANLLQLVLSDSIEHLKESGNYSKKTYTDLINMSNLYFKYYLKDKELLYAGKEDLFSVDDEFALYQDLIVGYNGLGQYEKAAALKPKLYELYFNDLEKNGPESLKKYFYTERFVYKDYFIEAVEYFIDFDDRQPKPHSTKHDYEICLKDKTNKTKNVHCDVGLFSLETVKVTKTASDSADYILAKRYYLEKNRRYVMEYVPACAFKTPVDDIILHRKVLDFLDNKIQTNGEIIYIFRYDE